MVQLCRIVPAVPLCECDEASPSRTDRREGTIGFDAGASFSSPVGPGFSRAGQALGSSERNVFSFFAASTRFRPPGAGGSTGQRV